MRKISVFTLFIIVMALAAGCGQADFAEVTVEDYRIEEDEAGATYLVLPMEIENLTDSTFI